MDEPFLYQKIAETFRQEILQGKLRAGDRLPSIRDLMKQWTCTPGTVQHAYQELANEGLVVSHAGKGTHVAGETLPARIQHQAPLRRAHMVHRAEAFLLEALTAGYEINEIQEAVGLALDRWRSLPTEADPACDADTIRFSGSHDMILVWLAAHIAEGLPGVRLKLQFTGSLGGLMALAEGKADLAGCHLWDADSGCYNEPFVRKLFPGKTMALVHLARRRIGLMAAPGNPLGLRDLHDLARPTVTMINRQSGSGTRVWLDTQLHSLGIDPTRIEGYTQELATHSEVARAVAEGKADAGIGLEPAAGAFGLDFVPLVEESYDLVMHADRLEGAPLECSPIQTMLNWMYSEPVQMQLAGLRGYDFTNSGERKILSL